MKRIKKIISVMLTLAMALTMSVTAFATSGGDPTPATGNKTYNITISNNATGHVYKAYQIFTGDVYKDENSEKLGLTNIKWGKNISENGQKALLGTEYSDEVKFAESLQTGNGADVAKRIQPHVSGKAVGESKGPENGKYIIEGLVAGYYLVIDEETSGNLSANDAYSAYILEVVGDAETTAKSDGIIPEKKVKDINDSVPGEGEAEWQDSADYDIGDEIEYQLKATLPENVEAYDKYELVFKDKLSEGLDYKEGTVKVKVPQVSGDFVAEEHYEVEYDKKTHELKIIFEDVKTTKATNKSDIIVEYKAILNSYAKIGVSGNVNTLTLEYSHNPNSDGKGTSTPVTAIVFTYKAIVNKVDQEGDSLTGAAFKLEKLSANEWVIVKEYKVKDQNPDSTFEFSGLDDGRYRLTETETPTGYNSIDPIYFTIEAKHDEEADDPKLTELKVYETTEDGNRKSEGNINEFSVSRTGDGEDATPSGDAAVSTNITNQKGSLLPSTGGIGTTIFYIVGGIIVVGAAILLVTKKRMSKEA